MPTPFKESTQNAIAAAVAEKEKEALKKACMAWDAQRKDRFGRVTNSLGGEAGIAKNSYANNNCDDVLGHVGGRRKTSKLGKKFNRCVKSVRKTVKARKGSTKESAAIAICTTSVLQTRGKTLKRYKKGRLVTQKKKRGGAVLTVKSLDDLWPQVQHLNQEQLKVLADKIALIGDTNELRAKFVAHRDSLVNRTIPEEALMHIRSRMMIDVIDARANMLLDEALRAVPE